tara:strand:+ start:4166 stop:4561 length:396 start_codon:yes stop_codon:yes gene_type:complete
MKIVLNVVPRPSSHSFTLMKDFDKEALEQTKTVTVRSTTVSKTRVSTSMQINDTEVNINLPVENFKTHEERTHSHFTGNYSTHNYFKLLKSQDFEVYKEYVKEVVSIAVKDYLNLSLDNLTINLITPYWNE